MIPEIIIGTALFAYQFPGTAAMVIVTVGTALAFLSWWAMRHYSHKFAHIHQASSRLRSLTKAVTWRTLGSLDTFALGWWITGSAVLGASVALAEIVTKTVLFYLHERGWGLVEWGRNPEGGNE